MAEKTLGGDRDLTGAGKSGRERAPEAGAGLGRWTTAAWAAVSLIFAAPRTGTDELIGIDTALTSLVAAALAGTIFWKAVLTSPNTALFTTSDNPAAVVVVEGFAVGNTAEVSELSFTRSASQLLCDNKSVTNQPSSVTITIQYYCLYSIKQTDSPAKEKTLGLLEFLDPSTSSLCTLSLSASPSSSSLP